MAATATKTRTKPAGNKKATKWTSRAVSRLVEPGSWVKCTLCDETVKFAARLRHRQAICNVYEQGVWQRVEHYHIDCYAEAGEPYGEAAE